MLSLELILVHQMSTIFSFFHFLLGFLLNFQMNSCNFFPCHQPRLKIGDEHNQEQKFCSSNVELQHTPNRASFFLLGMWRGVFSFICSQCVPIKFSMCSHQDLNGFPNMVLKFPMCSPTSSQERLTLSQMLCPVSWNLYWCAKIRTQMFVCLE